MKRKRKRMKLLLVDDDVISVQALLVGVNWEACGVAQVFYAFTVNDAKQIFEKESPDILLLDVEMPGESGLDFLSWVREKEENLGIPCAFMTCHPEFNYVLEAMHLHSFDYVLKPVEYQKVESLIRTMTEQRKTNREEKRLKEYGQYFIRSRVEEAAEGEQRPVDGKSAVEETVSYIMSHLSDKLLIEDLAERVHLNSDYLNRLFKRHKHISINKFIIQERMELAGSLLRENNMPAATVAVHVGYQNYNNFVSMFRKYYGMNPGEMSRKEKEQE